MPQWSSSWVALLILVGVGALFACVWLCCRVYRKCRTICRSRYIDKAATMNVYLQQHSPAPEFVYVTALDVCESGQAGK